MTYVTRQILTSAFAIMATALVGSRALADSAPAATPQHYTPPEYQNVGVDEHPNAQVPLDIPFMDDHATIVTLRQFMQKDRPVVLQLGYFGCPMLCDVISRNLIETAKKVDVTAGKDFQFVFLSIDSNEPPDLAMS